VIAFSGIIVFLIAFSLGIGGIVWTVNSEIYPLHVIGSAVSLATFVCWVANFIVATVFPLALHTHAGSVGIFCLLAVFCVMFWVFVYFLLPETANKEIS